MLPRKMKKMLCVCLRNIFDSKNLEEELFLILGLFNLNFIIQITMDKICNILFLKKGFFIYCDSNF